MDQNVIQCPYGDSCPQVIGVEGEIKTLNEKIEIQQKYIVEKINTIGSDVKEIKEFLNKDLDRYIDARINISLDRLQAKVLRWIIATLLGSGGLATIISLLIK